MKKLTEKTLEELSVDQAELQALRHRFAQEKMALQTQLAQVNAQLRGRLLPNGEFHQVNKHRANILQSLGDKERELAAINQQRAEVQAVIDVRKAQLFGPKQIKELVVIRDRWHEFSMDKTQHQKAREVAFKVSQELRELLRPYFAAAPEFITDYMRSSLSTPGGPHA